MREKEDWRGAYRFLVASASPGNVIAVCPFYNYPALRYHAGVAVGSAVLAVRANGDVVEIEHGLGTNPGWDKAYFRTALVPQMPGQQTATMSIPTTLQLQPGQSVWRVDGHCNPGFMADIEAALYPLTPDPEIAWMQKRAEPEAWGIVIHRYRVGAPTTLDGRDLAPPSRDRLPFRNFASAP